MTSQQPKPTLDGRPDEAGGLTYPCGTPPESGHGREIVPGVPMYGFECTISVEDIAATAAAIEAHGGKIVMPICTLAGVGQLLFFQDPGGTIAGAMQYETRPA